MTGVCSKENELSRKVGPKSRSRDTHSPSQKESFRTPRMTVKLLKNLESITRERGGNANSSLWRKAERSGEDSERNFMRESGGRVWGSREENYSRKTGALK